MKKIKKMKTKNQHYIPRFYLKYFSYNKEIVFLLKTTDKIIKSIKKFGSRNNYYTVKFKEEQLTKMGKDSLVKDDIAVSVKNGDITCTMENWIGTLENDVAPLITRINRGELSDALTAPDIVKLSIFCSMMLLRGIESEHNFYKKVLGKEKGRHTEKLTFRGYFRRNLSKKDYKKLSWICILPKCIEFATNILSNKLVQVYFLKGKDLVCSTNPVILCTRYPQRAVGITTKGVNILLPLGPHVLCQFYSDDNILSGMCDSQIIEYVNQYQMNECHPCTFARPRAMIVGMDDVSILIGQECAALNCNVILLDDSIAEQNKKLYIDQLINMDFSHKDEIVQKLKSENINIICGCGNVTKNEVAKYISKKLNIPIYIPNPSNQAINTAIVQNDLIRLLVTSRSKGR